MGETARSLLPALQVEEYNDLNEPLYTATVIFKCFGKDFSPIQVNAVAQIFKKLIFYRAITIVNLHKDGRSTVIHLLDACFRANVLKDQHSAEIFQEQPFITFCERTTKKLENETLCQLCPSLHCRMG